MSPQPTSPSVRVAAQRLAQIRHGRLRALWLASRPLVLLGVAAAAVALGFWGFRRYPMTADGNVLDTGYRTVRLFGLASGDASPPVPWQLEVARVLAPLVVGYAAIAGLIALFREQAQLLRLRLFARRHVVVCGLGATGTRIAHGLAEAGIRVVVVEHKPNHPGVAGCRRRGIPVISGDTTDPQVLADVRCDRARHILACCGADAANLGVLAACHKLAREPGWQPADVHVQIKAPGLWRRLNASRLEVDGSRHLRIDFLSVPDLAGRALVDAALVAWTAEHDRHHVAISANGELGRRVAVHAVRRARQHADDLVLTLIGPGAERDRELLLRESPWVFEHADLRTWSSDPSDPAPQQPDALADITVAFLCDADEDIALARAAGLAALTQPSNAPLYLAAGERRLVEALVGTGVAPDRIRPVAALDRVLGPDLLLDTLTERLARAKHDHFVRSALEQGTDPTADPSLVPWEELPESLKESNRCFADDLGAKLRELHTGVTPDDHIGAPAARLRLSARELERMARAEHERWVADLRADGWSQSAGAKDSRRKLHPLLVAWEQLPEDEREKDRAPIRDLPALLGAAGYALTPAGPASASPVAG